MSDDIYEGLKKHLVDDFNWPGVYLFKFIVPKDDAKIAEVKALFSEASEITTKESSSGKYISISAKELMLNPDAIIEKYKLAGKIKGLISL